MRIHVELACLLALAGSPAILVKAFSSDHPAAVEMQHECGMGKCMRGCRNVGGVKDPRILPETYVASSPISGEGLFANEDIEQGTEIGQYLGKVLTGEMLAEAMEQRGEEAMRY